MKRKQFLGALLPIAFTAGTGKVAAMKRVEGLMAQDDQEMVLPAYLQKGDTIGIACPGGFVTQDDIKPAVEKITEWGFKVKLGKTIGTRESGFAGTDNARAQDFQDMMDDSEVKAILCGRGGYGSIRVIDKLDFSQFRSHPKWIIGFSDITVMHSHVNRRVGVASIHSKMCNSFPADWPGADPEQVDSINSIHEALSGTKMTYDVPACEFNQPGMATGSLVGGNLRTLESLAGSVSDIVTKGKILFVEDTGEYLYSIDRMFWNMQRSGKLDRLKGLIIGGFKVKNDDPGEEFGKSLEEIVLEKTRGLGYPVCFGFPVGHQKKNYALKCGVPHRLRVDGTGAVLESLA